MSDAEALGDLSDTTKPDWIRVLLSFEKICSRFGHIRAYVGCLRAANCDDEAARREGGNMAALTADYHAVVATGLWAASEQDFESVLADEAIKDCSFWLTRMRSRSASFEVDWRSWRLTAVDGLRLGASCTMTSPGLSSSTWPMGGGFHLLGGGLLQDNSAAVRQNAFERSNEAVAEHGQTLVTALNAIAGRRITLQKWRGREVLEESRFEAGMSHETLKAMHQAVAERREIPRRFLKIKAGLLGKETNGFADIDAPLELGAPVEFEWSVAEDLVIRSFGSYHPDFSTFAASMFDHNYIEAEPRAGKRSGAFCTSSAEDVTSRIFMTYRGAMGDVRTLAHELGHAYHNAVMSEMRDWARHYPATLAETASIFAEQLVGDLLLKEEDTSEVLRLQVLAARMQSAVSYMLNIPMRFEFETAFYDERGQGTISLARACELMHEKQLEVYGDILGQDGTDPWFWASKLHFFLTGISFYNYPYTFGYLFSLGVRAQAERVGAMDFQETLVELLRQTGNGTVEDVAKRVLGVDLTKAQFWHASIDQVERDLKLFETALDRWQS